MTVSRPNRHQRAGHDTDASPTYYLVGLLQNAKAHTPDLTHPDEPACRIACQHPHADWTYVTSDDTVSPHCQWCAPEQTNTDCDSHYTRGRHTDSDDLIADGGTPNLRRRLIRFLAYNRLRGHRRPRLQLVWWRVCQRRHPWWQGEMPSRHGNPYRRWLVSTELQPHYPSTVNIVNNSIPSTQLDHDCRRCTCTDGDLDDILQFQPWDTVAGGECR